MTPRDAETLTLLYALNHAIEQRDWRTAEAMCERLLLVCAPLAPMPATDVRPDAARLAERRLTTLMH